MSNMTNQTQAQNQTKTLQQTSSGGAGGTKMVFKEQTAEDTKSKEIYKILKRPRSRKYMKAMATMDILSAGDEAIIAELKKRNGIEADADAVFTPDDIESFKNSIAEIIAEEIRKEEEAIRKAEEAERRRNTLLDIISPCGLEDCIIHRIDKYGNVLRHYTPSEVEGLDERYKRTRDIVMTYGGFANWSFVEIYGGRLVHRSMAGDTIKIYEIEGEGEE